MSGNEDNSILSKNGADGTLANTHRAYTEHNAERIRKKLK